MLYTRKKVCLVFLILILAHFKCRGVHDLKPHVSEDEYERLINFMYLETKEAVNEFSEWVKGLNNPKVQGSSI